MIEMEKFDTRNVERNLSNKMIRSRIDTLSNGASYSEDVEKSLITCLNIWNMQRMGIAEQKVYFKVPNLEICKAEELTNGELEDSLSCGNVWYELTLNNGNNSLCEIINKEKLYKIVDVEFRRTQTVKVKVVIPEDEDECNAEDYVDDFANLEDVSTCNTEDWECTSYSENDLCSASQIRAISNFDDDWFGEDNIDD